VSGRSAARRCCAKPASTASDPNQLAVVQAICALVVALLVTAITGAFPVGACLGAFAFFLPVGVVKRMRQRRQVVLRELWPEAVDNLGSPGAPGCRYPKR
jgi:tight adherence protein B